MYIRNRSIPVISTTPAALNAKARLANQSQAWQNLTAAERLAWNAWAQANPIVDSLGFSQILAGNAAFNSINIFLEQGAFTTLTVPPISTPPASLATFSFTADIGTGNVEAIFPPTPLPAATHLILRAAVVNSAAINYTENLKRIISFTTAAQASLYDFQTEIEAVFGALVLGQTVHMDAFTLSTVTGLRSLHKSASVVVIDTP